MYGELVLAILITVMGVMLIASIPKLLIWRTESYRRLSDLADQYASHVDGLSKEQAHEDIMDFVDFLGTKFGNPKLVRGLVIAAVTGQLAIHSRNPPAKSQEFTKHLSKLSEKGRNHLVSAMSVSLLASAEMSIGWGVVFKRMMVFNPSVQRDTVTAYASELCEPRQRFLQAA